MEQELHKIIMIPAKFVEKQPDEKYLLRCLMNENFVEDRLLDANLFTDIANPNHILIGIMTGVGYSQINVIDVDEFENIFNENWKILDI